MFRPALGVARVEMIYDLAGEVVENVYHVWNGANAAWTLVDLLALANRFVAWETTFARAERTVNCSLEVVKATDLTSLSGLQGVVNLITGIPGLWAGDSLPNHCTLAVKASTARGPRGSQGRSFWVGLAETMSIGNTLEVTTVQNIVSNLNALITEVSGLNASYALSVLHSKLSGAFLNPRIPTAITSFGARDNSIDSQRSRLPFKHRHKRTP